MGQYGKSLEEYAHLEADTVLKEVGTSSDGLRDEEAAQRIEKFGRNIIASKKEFNVFSEILSLFANPLVIILLFAGIVSIFFGQVIDSIIISSLVLLSIFIDFFQRYSASEAVKKLRERIKMTATVIRNGTKKEIMVSELCVGDVISLSAGDLVPADARIISAKDLFIDQSTLTGESFPVEKTAPKLDSKQPSLSELTNIVFMGTNVVSGSGTALLLKTGKESQFGKIASKLVSRPVQTEFERGVKEFSYFIMDITVFLVFFILLFSTVAKRDVFESFMFAVAIAVGLTPELLPMIMSVNMVKGSLNMAKKGVIVKKPSSIPNFGSMDVLCTDKTGTLTTGHIALVKYTDFRGNDSEEVLLNAYLNSFFQTGIRNPLDNAMLEFKNINTSEYHKVDEIPFDFVRKRMSVIAEHAKKRLLVTKGAPEELLRLCSCYMDGTACKLLDKESTNKIVQQYNALSAEGFRVLAVAHKSVGLKGPYTKADESDLSFLGFISFLDPPREDAKETVQELKKMGVDIKIITGDNEIVTQKICSELGLRPKGAMLGYEMEAISEDALKIRVENTTIFARVSPEQKNRIILALRSNNHVVGYMGDGINDAPSLKTADVGISVESGVDVAKETASIVLTQKSLGVLRDGVLEGRKTFGNTMKYIMMALSSNFGNMFSVAGAIMFLPFLPMLPLQILLNNLLYDISQIAIPTDNVDLEFIQDPKRWNIQFIRRFMFTFGPVSSVFDFVTFFILFKVLQVPAAIFQTGWFMESLATQTFVILIIRTQQVPFFKSPASAALVLATLLCVGVGWLLPYSPIGHFFKFQPIPLSLLPVLVGIVAVYVVLVEATKWVFYRLHEL